MGKAEEHVRVLRVVLVSPGDVADERVVATSVVDELNRMVAADRGCRLSLWRWETDARPGVHLEGPQGLIDELMDIQDANVVVGVFWKRFGTPTGDADSGTEHELRRAWAAWEERGRPEVMVYFCTRAYSPKSSAETTQWGRVLEFQHELPKQQLSWRYTKVKQFEALLREHLTRFLLTGVPASESRSDGAAGRRVRFNLPVLAAAFIGREAELVALDDALGIADRALITQAITGLGGVGKSQLAARYVQQRGDAYDVVAWIRAEDGGIADLAQLAAKLGVPVDGLSPRERAQLALGWLSDSTQRWLLVLDNVASAEQLEGLRPRAGSGRVLVTSRDRALRQFGPVLPVDVFDEDTATAYLIERAGRPGEDRAARQLARALGCLPLALSHAAAYCQSGTSFEDYLALLGELPVRELFTTHPEVFYEQTVASTWKTSIQAASAIAPLAEDVLEMAAHLAPDAIPKSLFRVLVDADTAIGRKRLADALNALARFSLATVDDDSVSVHRLLQKTVRDNAVARDGQSPALRALAALHDAFPDDCTQPTQWALCEQLLPHVLALADVLSQPGEAAPHVVELLNRACAYLSWAEPGQRGLSTAQRTLRQAERILGAQPPDTLVCTYQDARGIDDAIAIFQPLLADIERVLGAEHPDTLNIRNKLAVAYRRAGRIEDAIAIVQRILADCERILDTAHPLALSTRNNLASVLQDAGRVDEAIAIYKPLLADYERILGADHLDTLSTRNNLAIAYRRAGRTDQAIATIGPLLADRERILAATNPETLSIANNVAGTLHDALRVDDAITIFEALLAQSERILGAEHPDTLSTRNSLASAYHDAGRIDDAIAIFETLLADRERILGTEHSHALVARNNLAHAYRAAGRADEAIAIYEPLLTHLERRVRRASCRRCAAGRARCGGPRARRPPRRAL